MNTAEADFSFPVLCFTNHEEVHFAEDLRGLTTWQQPALLAREAEIGMELIDSQGKRWVVGAIQVLGRANRWSVKVFFGFRYRSYTVDYELVAELPVSLHDVKQRLLTCIEAKPELWSYDLDHCPSGIPVPTDDALAWVEAGTSIGAFANKYVIDPLDSYCGPREISLYRDPSNPREAGPIDPDHYNAWRVDTDERIARHGPFHLPKQHANS